MAKQNPRQSKKPSRKPKKRVGITGGNRPKIKPDRHSSENTQSQTLKNTPSPNQHWIYGHHAVKAALANPRRKIISLFATKKGTDWLLDHGLREAMIEHQAQDISPSELDNILPYGAAHQGVAIEVQPLPPMTLEDLAQLDNLSGENTSPVLVLDQLTDPQNIGAIFRSAAAFGVRAILSQDRRTPPLTGALAKAAVGAVDLIPHIPVVNIARSLETLKTMGFTCVGLAGEAKQTIHQLRGAEPIALVVGAEGTGLRPLVQKNCDLLVHIPIHPQMESLNAAAATAVALYAVQR